ncbi:cadherin-like protein 26 [Callorhinchus milii]|uniref:cadherin-like protein 26 n=1 Tax=Callorhinchus milii TaxID=7868 RepID=UPI001C3FE12B|nr:cadherin-like protein 26 [Callorhinchus milii]
MTCCLQFITVKKMYIAVLLFTMIGMANCLPQNEGTLASKQEPFHISKTEVLRTEQTQEQPKTVSNKPLRRMKRAWVLKTFTIEENDKGPFPKKVHTFPPGYTIDGPGINEEPNMGLFKLNEKSELVVNGAIDREKIALEEKSTIKLHAAYSQSGSSNRPLVIIIIVKDLNDNIPQFTQKEYWIEVPENTTEEIHQVKAYDADQENHPNSNITYTITSQTPKSSDIIAIDSKTGMIYFRGCLDYQTVSKYTLKIEASDNGIPKHTNSTLVVISVLDQNNHAPTFVTNTYTFSVVERKQTVTGPILQVIDKDLPNTAAWRAKFSITKGNEDGHFEIRTDLKTNEGHLVLVKPYDFEAQTNSEINLEISVENEEPLFTCSSKPYSKKKNSITVLIKLIDANDPPEFQPPIVTMHLEEGLKSGHYLNTFTAIDVDKIYKNNIRYEKGFDPDDWVDVDSETGIVKTKKVLDRESIYVKNNFYNVTILAIDDATPPLTGTGTLVIFLTDINDNTPFLKFTTLNMCSIHSKVKVTAVDKDNYPFSHPFIFEFLENENGIKDKWKFGTHDDNSTELVKLQDFPVGTYSLPLRIHDKQNLFNDDILTLRICHCPDGRNCLDKAPSSALGGDAIVLIFASLLLLLFVFLLSWSKAKTKLKHFEKDGISSLKKYNIECQPDQKHLMDWSKYVTHSSAKRPYRSGVNTTKVPFDCSEHAMVGSYRSGANNSVNERYQKAHFQYNADQSYCLLDDNLHTYTPRTSSVDDLQKPFIINGRSHRFDFHDDAEQTFRTQQSQKIQLGHWENQSVHHFKY